MSASGDGVVSVGCRGAFGVLLGSPFSLCDGPFGMSPAWSDVHRPCCIQAREMSRMHAFGTHFFLFIILSRAYYFPRFLARADMLRHVKHAVDGTFFDRWLSYVRLAHQASATAFVDETMGERGSSTGRHGQVAEGKDAGVGAEGERGGRETGNGFMACEHEEEKEGEGEEGTGVKGGGGQVTGGRSSSHSHPRARPRPGCRMCGWVGRCPRESKLEPQEFEAAVRAIARDKSIGMIEKSKAVQTLRAAPWQQKRARPGPTVTAGTAGRIHPPPPPSFLASTTSTTSPSPSHHIVNHEIPHAPGAKDHSGSSPSALTAPAVAAPLPPPHRPPSADTEALDRSPSYTPTGEFGCVHYRRACKLRAPCCGRLYPCRLCHDQALTDHAMDRYAVAEICCMRCGELQPPARTCRNPHCRHVFSAYYCDICRLYDDDVGKAIYHCPYCNVCRLGKGLGIDFRHCMTCNACVSLAVPPERHKCIEQALQRDCPVCSEPLFTSTTHYKVLSCGHSMHRQCYNAYRQTAYTCPICKKSMEDMSSHFAGLDLLLQAYPMPPEFATWRSDVLCQDCGEESRNIPYHFLYHKCANGCGSYNTRVLQAGDRGNGGRAGQGGEEGFDEGNRAI